MTQAKGGSDKVEDLLKPRYKVIAKWPKMEYLVGNIIVIENDGGNLVSKTEDGGWLEYECFYKDYPHLFKRLFWHEEREADEMPEYVKYIHDGHIYKISDADEIHPFAIMFKHKYIEEWVYYLKCLPATEADYTQYIKTKNK